MSTKLFSVLVAAALLAVSGAVAAQNFFPGNAKPPPGDDPRSKKAEAPDYREYDYGREIYAVKLGCQTCPLGDKPLNEETARRFMEDDTLWRTLTPKEYSAVTTYLRELFTL